MTKRRAQNQMLCARIPQNLKLERSKSWGTNGTFLYCVKIKNAYYNYPNEVLLGIFETEQERDLWFYKWEEILKNYKNDLKI